MMVVYGNIIVIKRNGSDGSSFPLSSNTCLIGRGPDCDIRIQLGTVSQEHSRLDVKSDGQILLTNLSKLNPTTLNYHPVKNSVHVCHMDIITVADRSLRWEFPANSQYYNSPKQASPGKYCSPNAGNLVLNSSIKTSPDSKSPSAVDRRSFKVTLGTPHHSPGRRSLQKPLSGKKVPFFLTPKPGKRTPKKTLSSTTRGYLSPEIVADSKSSPGKSSPKTPSPKIPTSGSHKSTPTTIKKISPKATPKTASPKTPSPKPVKKASLSPQKPSSGKKASPKVLASKKKPSPKIASKNNPSPKAPAKRGSVSPKKPSPTVGSSKSVSPSPNVKKSPSPKPSKKTARFSLPAKQTPTKNKRASDSGFNSRGGRQSLLRSGQSSRSFKVSFGPNLSPEQFDRALPPTTPLKKGGRPKRGSLTSPNYYGNPVISSNAAAKSPKRSISPAAVCPKAKKIRAEEQLPISPKKSLSSKTPSHGPKSPKSVKKIDNFNKRKSSSPNVSPKKERKSLVVEENVVKIFSPASPDSKKSAALRTIHAKLVLNKTVKKRASESPNRKISPATAKQKLLAKSRKSADSGISGATLESMSANSSFDMQTLQTPYGPNEMFVSPMTVQRGASPSFSLRRMIRASPSPLSKSTRTSMRFSGKFDRKAKSRFPIKSPKSDYTDVEGVKRLMKSPRKSPRSDYTDVEGVKRLMKSPRKSPKSDYTNVEGVKRLMKSPRKSPNSDYTNVEGVERLFRSKQKSPKSDYTNVKGVKRIFRQRESPKDDCANVNDLKSLIKRSPKDDAHEKPSISPMKFYPNRQNKLGPVNYLGFEKEKSPGNSRSSPLTPKEKRTLGALVRSLSPSSKENLVEIISSGRISPVLKQLSASKSPTRSSAMKSSASKISSIKKSPNLKRLSFGGSPVLMRSFAKSPLQSQNGNLSLRTSDVRRSRASGTKSPALKQLSASRSPTRPSAKKLSTSKISSIEKSPILKRLSTDGSPVLRRSFAKSPLRSQNRNHSLTKSGKDVRGSRASFSPALNQLYLSPVVSKLPSPIKRLFQSPSQVQASSSNVSPKSVGSAVRTSTSPVSKTSPKSQTNTPSKATPVSNIVPLSGKSSVNKRQMRSTRSAKRPVKYSPASPMLRHKGNRANKMSPRKGSPSSPVKTRVGRSKKDKNMDIPDNEENDEPLGVSPKAVPVRRTRKVLKTAQKSLVVSRSSSPTISFKKTPSPTVPAKKTRATKKTKAVIVTPRKSPTISIKKTPSPAVPAKKTRATKKTKAVIVTPRKSPTTPIESSPSLPAKKTRGRSKKSTVATSPSNKRKAESLAASPKAISPPKRKRRGLTPLKPLPSTIESSPVKSPSPVAARKTRTKASKAKASPKDVKQTKKSKIAVTSVESPPKATPKRGRTLKVKVIKSPKTETPTVASPKKTRRGAAQKVSPAKKQSPKASPVASRKKGPSTGPSPARLVVSTRSSRRNRK